MFRNLSLSSLKVGFRVLLTAGMYMATQLTPAHGASVVTGNLYSGRRVGDAGMQMPLNTGALLPYARRHDVSCSGTGQYFAQQLSRLSIEEAGLTTGCCFTGLISRPYDADVVGPPTSRTQS